MTLSDPKVLSAHLLYLTLAFAWVLLCLFGSMITFAAMCDLIMHWRGKR